MIASARVTHCTPRQDGRHLVVAQLESERRPITVVSAQPIPIGNRIRVDGAGALWHLADEVGA